MVNEFYPEETSKKESQMSRFKSEINNFNVRIILLSRIILRTLGNSIANSHRQNI